MTTKYEDQIFFVKVRVLKLRECDFELGPKILLPKLKDCNPSLLLIPEMYRHEFTRDTLGLMDVVVPQLSPTCHIAFY